MANPIVRCLAGSALALSTIIALAAGDPTDQAIAGVMNPAVKPGEPGCTVGVLQGGALTHAGAFGMADIGRGKPLDSHAVFNLASVSKQFTAFALLLLEQQGKLKLDDPVVKYLPELSGSAQGVTLAHLVHHTGGLRDYIEILYMKGRGDADGTTIDEAVRLLARQTAPNEKPGVEFDYSNTGYFLLGVVIARVSGQSLAEFSRQQIFEPLGMKNTSIIDRYPAPIPALARGYAAKGTGFRIDETGWEQVGDGQVHSDLHDLALWDENFYTGKVGGRELVGTDVRGRQAEFRQVHGLRRGPQRLQVPRPHLGHARRFLGRLPLEHRARAGRARLGHRALQPCRSGCRRLRSRNRADPARRQARPAGGGTGGRGTGAAAGDGRMGSRRPLALRGRLLQRGGRCALRARPARRAPRARRLRARARS